MIAIRLTDLILICVGMVAIGFGIGVILGTNMV